MHPGYLCWQRILFHGQFSNGRSCRTDTQSIQRASRRHTGPMTQTAWFTGRSVSMALNLFIPLNQLDFITRQGLQSRSIQ